MTLPRKSDVSPVPHYEPESERVALEITRVSLRYILDQQDTGWAVAPGDMDQRFVANQYAIKLERIFRRARNALDDMPAPVHREEGEG